MKRRQQTSMSVQPITLTNTEGLSSISRAIRASLISISLAQGAAQAATVTVTSSSDDGVGCTLRNAIVSANVLDDQGNGCAAGSNGTDNIVFADDLVSNTIILTGGRLSFDDKDIQLDASSISGGITLDANNDSSVLQIESNSTLTIDNLTITGGAARTGAGIRNSGHLNLSNSRVIGNFDGGIYNRNSMILDNTTVSYNSTIGRGGGIRSRGTMSLSNSTISGNTASYGGGIDLLSDTVTVTNSTISGNSAVYGGGITSSTGTLGLINATISGNSVSRTGGGLHFNYYSGGTVLLQNSIIANSRGGNDCTNLSSYFDLVIDSATIIEDSSSCGASRSGDPGLLALADNGGATKTHALKSNSIARNTGVLSTCEIRDQRGQLRSDGDAACDVGAFEFNKNDDSGFIVIPIVKPKGGNKVRAVVIPN